MQPTAWQPGDIDVYCLWIHAETFHRHLLETQDCVFVQTKTGEDTKYPVYALREVRYYTCLSTLTREREQFQLIVIGPDGGFDQFIEPFTTDDNCYDPLKAILEGFHSTVVMNLILGTCAISLFPNSTVIRGKNHLAKQFDNAKKRGVDKYIQRGWVLAEVLPRDRIKVSNPMQNLRAIGDKYCWRIDFNPQGISKIPANASYALPALCWTTSEAEEKVWREYQSDAEPRSSMQRIRIYWMGTDWSHTNAWHSRMQRFHALWEMKGKERIS